MSDCNNLFRDFNHAIRLTNDRRIALTTARQDLRTRITNSFNTHRDKYPNVREIKFQSQGSFVMDTIINPISEDYDLDDGVYFIGGESREKRPEPKYFHDFVYHSVKDGNPFVKEVQDKPTCVRALYKEGFRFMIENRSNELVKGFHVDMPMYYSNTIKCPDLAHLEDSWTVSDPIEFITWFEEKANSSFNPNFLYEQTRFFTAYNSWQEQVYRDDVQLRRVIRYLKAWCDFKGSDMPCGIILTILGVNNYVWDSNDDISLHKTLVKMKQTLDAKFECLRPTTPKDEDLFEGYEDKASFMQRLSEFVTAASQAINETNQKRACAKWQSQFGVRFSCVNALDIDENARTFKAPAVITDNAKSA